jgi:hypothetical protein
MHISNNLHLTHLNDGFMQEMLFFTLHKNARTTKATSGLYLPFKSHPSLAQTTAAARAGKGHASPHPFACTCWNASC